MVNFRALNADGRTAIAKEDVNVRAYSRTLQHLRRFNFWNGRNGAPSLWEHQRVAIATSVAYLKGDKKISERPGQTEAALLKLPTGTGKSGIVAVIARCLPEVQRVLVLTPRTALTEQLMADISYRFWKHIGYATEGKKLFQGEADTLGASLEGVYVEQLLPRNVTQLTRDISDDAIERIIFVGTHQALSDIRKTADDPNADAGVHCNLLLQNIRERFDLVVVDEGHYEPAISWSRGVREFNLPTLLLSATPYRNDYKSFRVQGRYLFNLPYQQAVESRIIRPSEVIGHGEGGESQGEHAVEHFVQLMKKELPNRLAQAKKWFRDGTKPKVMVRADDLESLYALQNEINRVFDTRAVVIHDRAKKSANNEDRFSTVSSAKREQPDAEYWVHQNKLMEGIDDPAFVAVAIFDLMSNARQLVQQVGRVSRYSNGDLRFNQTAWVLGSPANAGRIQVILERYQGYEEYASNNTSHIVANEVTLPDRLLEFMAEYQYIDGEFRARYEFKKALSAGDIQLPRTAAILEATEPNVSLDGLKSAIEDSILDKDRFKVTPLSGMPANTLGFSYYAWRSSPFLIDRFFSEWKLGIFIAVHHDNLFFMHDTEGLVVSMGALNLVPVSRSAMEKVFPEDATENTTRLSRMSFLSLDMSQHAIRSMAMRTRSFSETFTDLLDPSLVPSTAAGFVAGNPRYVGFSRSRIRDGSERYISLYEYINWTRLVADEITDEGRQRSEVFSRYASIVEGVDEQGAKPLSILLDPSLDDMRDDDFGGASFVLHEDAGYFDLCADVDGEGGSFSIDIDGHEIQGTVEFNGKTRKYHIESDELNAKFPVTHREGRRQGQTIVQRLNQKQAFRILTSEEGVIYSEGSFYKPRLRWTLDDGSKPILDYMYASEGLNPVDSEKGENYFDRSFDEWQRRSIFGLFSAVCDEQPNEGALVDDCLASSIRALPIWLCDDDGREVADFIGLDPASKRIILVHAKVGSQRGRGQGYNVGGLQVVGRQALASLGFIYLGMPSDEWTPQRWGEDVYANTTPLRGQSRIFRNAEGLSVEELNEILCSACQNPSFEKEVWIVGANMVRKSALEESLDHNQYPNRLKQFLMHWDAMQTACARANSRLKFFCSA